MPGLSVWRTGDPTAAGFADTLDSLCFFDDYQAEAVARGGDTRVGYTASPSYPVETVADGSRTVVLEGRLYDRNLTTEGLLELGGRLLDPDADTSLRRWLRDTDGDFLLCALDGETGDIAVLNDLFGRLPVYYTDAGDGYRVSREIRFLLGDGDVAFDRVGIGQTLLFGYVLGERTHWESVSKLPPASVLRMDGDDLSVERLHRFDFGTKRHRDRSVGRNARELAGLFTEACRARDGDPTVVSLSGGHDSRAVAAGFEAADVPVRAATFARRGEKTRDVTVAQEVAGALGVPWDRYDLPPTSTAQARTLLDLKAGLNHVGMGFILGFFEALRSDHGPALTYVTGDGGDKALPDLSPPKRLSTLSALVDYTIAKNSVFPLARAADLAGVSERRLRSSVRAVLASYPETSLADRYVHFLTHERGFNWLFEGEDRNRYYVWTTSPFYSPSFYRYAMNVPDDQKADNRLYREFFSALWPPATTFPDADFATPMASARYGAVQRALDVLARYPTLEDTARQLYRGELRSGDGSDLERLIDDQLSSLEEWAPRAADGDPPEGSRHALLTLLTVLASVELVRSGTSVFERAEDLVVG